MIAWEELARVPAQHGGRSLSLHRRGDELVIRADGIELMSSRRTGSEEALARLARDAFHPSVRGDRHSIQEPAIQERATPPLRQRVLVGGLGMGFTAAASLAAFPDARVIVAEIAEPVVDWNRRWLAPLANLPLDDPRLDIHVIDVRSLIEVAAAGPASSRFDAILLDVDNGPEALSRRANAGLYDAPGLAATLDALRPGGVVGYWSAGPDDAFTRRLERVAASLEMHRVPSRGKGSRTRARHAIWIAQSAS